MDLLTRAEVGVMGAWAVIRLLTAKAVNHRIPNLPINVDAWRISTVDAWRISTFVIWIALCEE
jgi:hypothetical protein